MTENSVPLEIERKYLIRMPERARLERESVKRIEIRQIYLITDEQGGSRRLRHSRWADGEARYYTEKIRLTDMTRIEREREITGAEWETLASQADPSLRAIEKVRWCVPREGHVLEIDVFPFWADRAICEVELRSEEEDVSLPDWLQVIFEVTEDIRYVNRSMAEEIPFDPLDTP